MVMRISPRRVGACGTFKARLRVRCHGKGLLPHGPEIYSATNAVGRYSAVP